MNENRVRVLPIHFANKISAGEVVERPASVVKELVENAIDAGASNIRISIVSGGKKLISVQDDGCGMVKEDALLSLERQATSKILDESDIENITTLGFRGEAIPSIASVSRFSMTTRRKNADEGFFLQVNAGNLGTLGSQALGDAFADTLSCTCNDCNASCFNSHNHSPFEKVLYHRLTAHSGG
jgi:DNA mismatch repair protein MutL